MSLASRLHALWPGGRSRCRRRRFDPCNRWSRWRSMARRADANGARCHRLRGERARFEDRNLRQCRPDHSGGHFGIRRGCARGTPDQRWYSRRTRPLDLIGSQGLPRTSTASRHVTRWLVRRARIDVRAGSFDARLEQWTTLGVYARTKLLELLAEGICDHLRSP